MNLTMDSSALIALLRQEEGTPVVRELLLQENANCFVHAVNLCEVYYGFRREKGESPAQKALQVIESLGVTIREDMDSDFWQAAGRCKADLRRISLADCFCIALAQRIGGEVVTADRHEFEAASEARLCAVTFIR